MGFMATRAARVCAAANYETELSCLKFRSKEQPKFMDRKISQTEEGSQGRSSERPIGRAFGYGCVAVCRDVMSSSTISAYGQGWPRLRNCSLRSRIISVLEPKLPPLNTP